MALTADCLACAAGEEVKDFCEDNPEVIGCEEYATEDANNETEVENEEEGDEE
jgi:hypothetical protein